MRFRRALIYLWVSPTTAVGVPLMLAALVSGGGVQCVDGVLEVYGGLAAGYLNRVVGLFLSGGASAMTLGHIVVGVDRQCLELTRAHERIHVRQCERWGPLFIPLYLIASAVQFFRGKRGYMDNPFEREAYESAGGISRASPGKGQKKLDE